MFFRRVTWHLWAGLAVVAVAYILLGIWFRGDGTLLMPLYKWGLVSLTLSPIVLLAGYTASGNKWWKNEVGSSLGVLSFGIVWMAWPLAWTFVFWNGLLKPGWVAWTEVSGPAVITMAALWFTWVNLRLDRERKRRKSSGNETSGGV